MKNYTSTVAPERSIAEIETLLVRAGARSITREYTNGAVTALNFVIAIPGTEGAPIGVRLPADVDAVYQVLKKNRSPRAAWTEYTQPKLLEQAKRTAWKLMWDWCAVQLSLIEMQQAELMQVFLPYLWSGRGTFYQQLRENKFAALGYEPKREDAAPAE